MSGQMFNLAGGCSLAPRAVGNQIVGRGDTALWIGIANLRSDCRPWALVSCYQPFGPVGVREGMVFAQGNDWSSSCTDSRGIRRTHRTDFANADALEGAETL